MEPSPQERGPDGLLFPTLDFYGTYDYKPVTWPEDLRKNYHDEYFGSEESMRPRENDLDSADGKNGEIWGHKCW